MLVIVISVKLGLPQLCLIRPVATDVFVRTGKDRCVDVVIRPGAVVNADGVAPTIWLSVDRYPGLHGGIDYRLEALNLQFTRNPPLGQRNQPGNLLVNNGVRRPTPLKVVP